MSIESKSPRSMNVTAIDLLPEPLKKVRAYATKLLNNMLVSMFDNTDDALFELADKAENNADQTMYFDSMREVRIKREAMEARFSRAIQDNFKPFYRGASALDLDSNVTSAESEESGFSLVQNDELEESVATRGMISKARNLFAEPLSQLTQRMDFLLSASTVNDENNPLGPAQLSDAFLQACQELELDIRAKLVVFKLYEKFVLGDLQKVYDWSNQSLITSGVMPEIKSSNARKQSSRKRSDYSSRTSDGEKTAEAEGAASSASDGFDDDQSEVFSLLRGLLATSGSQQYKSQAGQLPVADSGPVLSHSDLVGMLSQVQQQSRPVDNLSSWQPERIDIRQALYNLVDHGGNSTPQAVGRVDDDSINLVSMLFEFILDDHNLPVPMKAVLGRLQIPMLKVALLDKTFFSLGAHPARKLLNELAKAALSWNEPADISRDALFNKISSVVERLLNDFDNDVGIFAPLLEEFGQFVGGERRKADLIEQRTRDAEEGLGKTQRARAEVGKLINDKAAGKRLPAAAVSIFREGWSNYLFLLFVKEGSESEAWTNGVQVVDDLIWSVSRDDSFGHRSGLLRMIPSLLKRLREGLNAISFSKNRMRELFSELEGIHMECLRSKPEVSEDAIDTQASDANVHDDSLQQSDNLAGDKPSKVVESEIIVEAPVLESLDTAEAAEASGNEFEAVVDSMVVGAWVEFLGQGKENTRCKLAAIIRASGKYIFVNRVGIKVAEYTRSSLIEAAKQSAFSMLDNGLLFDRALESVIGHLREMKD
ncbi:MAG: DUF1631 domain-containing protein [Pseudomonadales bacterium]